MIKTPLETDLSEYLIPKKFPARVVALVAQSIFTAVQLTNATPKDILKKFEIITVDGLRWTETGTPFFKTDRGFVKADKHQLRLLNKQSLNYVFEDVTSVYVVSPSFYYTDVNFNDKTRTTERTSRGEYITVEAVEWTTNGLPRLKTAKGYITANKDFVSTSSKLMAYIQKAFRKLTQIMKKKSAI